MPKSKSRKSAKKPAPRAPKTPFLPQKVQRPGADAGRDMSRTIKPVPLPGKSRGR